MCMVMFEIFNALLIPGYVGLCEMAISVMIRHFGFLTLKSCDFYSVNFGIWILVVRLMLT